MISTLDLHMMGRRNRSNLVTLCGAAGIGPKIFNIIWKSLQKDEQQILTHHYLKKLLVLWSYVWLPDQVVILDQADEHIRWTYTSWNLQVPSSLRRLSCHYILVEVLILPWNSCYPPNEKYSAISVNLRSPKHNRLQQGNQTRQLHDNCNIH